MLLLDMTKAFDTIKREDLCKLLSDILDPDELNNMNILLRDVMLQVENKGTQLLQQPWNCLSVILFTLSLSNTSSAKISLCLIYVSSM